MVKRKRRLRLTTAIAMLLSACATAPPGDVQPTASLVAGSDLPPGFYMNQAIDKALEDAQRRTGLDRAALKVVHSESVIWHDSSLGCPAPGAMLSEAMTPGFRIRIEAGTETLDYHAPRRGRVRYCPPGQAITPSPRQPRQ